MKPKCIFCGNDMTWRFKGHATHRLSCNSRCEEYDIYCGIVYGNKMTTCRQIFMEDNIESSPQDIFLAYSTRYWAPFGSYGQVQQQRNIPSVKYSNVWMNPDCMLSPPDKFLPNWDSIINHGKGLINNPVDVTLNKVLPYKTLQYDYVDTPCIRYHTTGDIVEDSMNILCLRYAMFNDLVFQYGAPNDYHPDPVYDETREVYVKWIEQKHQFDEESIQDALWECSGILSFWELLTGERYVYNE